MGFGLFGKVPQKRDYLALNLPLAVLNPFESWLASVVASSRMSMGERWEDFYLVAPIWRFWLPPSLLGTACAGALMPSTDAGGRYFPVAIIYVASKGEHIASPLTTDQRAWYADLDRRLLMILDEPDDRYLANLLSGLSNPVTAPAASPPDLQPSLWWRGDPGSDNFQLLTEADLPSARSYEQMLLWREPELRLTD